MPDDELVVQVEKDEPQGATTVAVDKPEQKSDDPILADLKAQLSELESGKERERQEKETARAQVEAERQARVAAEAERDAGRTEIVKTQIGTLEQGLAAAQTASDAAKAEIKSAMEAGDWSKVADAQEKLADARADIKTLNAAKLDLESVDVVRKPERQPIEAPQTVDPVERMITLQPDGRPRSQVAQNWLRKNKDFVTDNKKLFKLTAAHNDALSADLTPESPEYFAHVEKFLGLTKEQPRTNGANGVPPSPRRSASSAPVAPVSNTNGGGPTGGGREVRLSAGEAKTATDGTLVWNYDDPSPQKKFKKGDPIGTQEFARRKAILQDQGKYANEQQ